MAYDGNGSVMALADATDSAITAQYEYGPFGEALRTTGPLAQENPCRFLTTYHDTETRLLYLGKEYYSSDIEWLNQHSMVMWPPEVPVDSTRTRDGQEGKMTLPRLDSPSNLQAAQRPTGKTPADVFMPPETPCLDPKTIKTGTCAAPAPPVRPPSAPPSPGGFGDTAGATAGALDACARNMREVFHRWERQRAKEHCLMQRRQAGKQWGGCCVAVFCVRCDCCGSDITLVMAIWFGLPCTDAALSEAAISGNDTLLPSCEKGKERQLQHDDMDSAMYY